jgi:hypothetical protein
MSSLHKLHKPLLCNIAKKNLEQRSKALLLRIRNCGRELLLGREIEVDFREPSRYLSTSGVEQSGSSSGS